MGTFHIAYKSKQKCPASHAKLSVSRIIFPGKHLTPLLLELFQLGGAIAGLQLAHRQLLPGRLFDHGR